MGYNKGMRVLVAILLLLVGGVLLAEKMRDKPDAQDTPAIEREPEAVEDEKTFDLYNIPEKCDLTEFCPPGEKQPEKEPPKSPRYDILQPMKTAD